MNINLDLNDPRLSRQEKDQLSRLIPQKKDQDTKVNAITEQLRLIGDQFVHMGFGVDQMRNAKTADGYTLNLLGISIHYNDKHEPLKFLEQQKNSIDNQIVTLKRNLQHELKQQKEIGNKLIDIYEHYTKTEVKRPVNEKKQFTKDNNQANKEFKSVERQLEKDMGEICRT